MFAVSNLINSNFIFHWFVSQCWQRGKCSKSLIFLNLFFFVISK